MSKADEIIGQRFGRLVVLRKTAAGDPIHKPFYVACQCDCGNRSYHYCYRLVGGRVKSCGCSARTHGRSGGKYAKAYRAWRAMHRRCTVPTDNSYRWYGARGVRVCERWNEIDNFIEDLGLPPEGHSLDRIDVNGNYEPGNCRWATPRQQSNNQRTNIRLTINNETRTIAEWARRFGICNKVVYNRMDIGWSPQRALTTPHKRYRKTKNAA